MKKVFIFLLLVMGFLKENPAVGQEFDRIFSSLDRERTPNLYALFRHDSIRIYPDVSYSYLITTLDSSKFQQFMDEAWVHGLQSYVVDSSYRNTDVSPKVGTLTFKREKRIVLGEKRILLSNEFLENTYEETSGYWHTRPDTAAKNKNHVIFVYDPHDCVAQVPLIVSAIKEVVQKNPGRSFALLDEGYFDFKGRDIPLETTLGILSDSLPLDYQVKALTDNYLIDAVMAYRILYDRKIRAIAIDDPKLIKEEVEYYVKVTYSSNRWGTRTISRLKEDIDKKLRKAHLATTERKVQDLLATGSSFGNYSIDVSVEELKKERDVYTSLIAILSKIQTPSFKDEIDDLKMYLAETINDIYYVRRDSVMSFCLNDFLAKNPDVTPIVFIGQAHAQDLIKGLPAGTGYSVFAGRVVGCGVREEFANLLNFDTGKRDQYIRHILDDRGHLKSAVAMLEGEAPAYRKFISDLRKIYLETDPGSDIGNALRSSRSLQNAEFKIVKIREDLPLPTHYQNVFGQAFGEIRVSEYGQKSLILLDEGANATYSIHDRAALNFIQQVNLETAYGGYHSGISNFVDEVSNTRFFSVSTIGPNGARVYYLFRDPSPVLQRSLYFLDRGPIVFQFINLKQLIASNEYSKHDNY